MEFPIPTEGWGLEDKRSGFCLESGYFRFYSVLNQISRHYLNLHFPGDPNSGKWHIGKKQMKTTIKAHF